MELLQRHGLVLPGEASYPAPDLAGTRHMPVVTVNIFCARRVNHFAVDVMMITDDTGEFGITGIFARRKRSGEPIDSNDNDQFRAKVRRCFQ